MKKFAAILFLIILSGSIHPVYAVGPSDFFRSFAEFFGLSRIFQSGQTIERNGTQYEFSSGRPEFATGSFGGFLNSNTNPTETKFVLPRIGKGPTGSEGQQWEETDKPRYSAGGISGARGEFNDAGREKPNPYGVRPGISNPGLQTLREENQERMKNDPLAQNGETAQSIIERMVNSYQNRLEQYRNFMVKVQARRDKLAAEGKDTEKLDQFIGKAQIQLEAVQTELATIKQKLTALDYSAPAGTLMGQVRTIFSSARSAFTQLESIMKQVVSQAGAASVGPSGSTGVRGGSGKYWMERPGIPETPDMYKERMARPQEGRGRPEMRFGQPEN